METGKTNNTKNDIIDKLQIDDKLVTDYTKLSVIFNQNFTSIAKVNATNNNHNTSSANNRYISTPTHYLLQSFNCTFSNFKLMSLSTKYIRNIIKSLN